MWNPFVIIQQLIFTLWAVKEMTPAEKLQMWATFAKQYAYTRYMQAWITFQEMFFTNSLSTANLIVVLGVAYGIYRLAEYLKGRHRTPNQEMVQETKQASTNVVHVHNAVQLGSETRSSNYSEGLAGKCKEYTEGTDLNAWFSLLEYQLECNVRVEKWVETTITLLQMKMIKQLGDLRQYAKNAEGFELLKSTSRGGGAVG